MKISPVVMSGRRAELQGSYKSSQKPGYLKVEEEGTASWREGGRKPKEDFKLDYGEFKQAERVVREASGVEKYNFKLIRNFGREMFGVVSDAGEKLYLLDNDAMDVDILSRITAEEASELG